MTEYRACPKCGHVPPQPMDEQAQCPACGIYLFKWVAAQSQRDNTPKAEPAASFSLADVGMAMLEPLPQLDPVFLYGRAAVLLLFALWSWSLIGYDYAYGDINNSFMHAILLPIHEAGHVFLRPFGEFMTILGGSLFQLALPFGIGVAFVVMQRDNFGAAICLWWTGISLVDLSPYIYDAFNPRLVLLGGHTGEDGPHDWIYLLGEFGQVLNAHIWGKAAHTAGAVIAVVALVWGGVVLLRQRRQ